MRRKGAFTFVELLLVIIILGVATAVSVPNLRKSYTNFVLENFTKDIYYLGRFLQSNAVAQGKIYCLNIDYNDPAVWLTVKEKDGFARLQGKFSKSFRAPAQVKLSSLPANFSPVYFYPDASMDRVTIIMENQDNFKVFLIFEGASGGIKIKK